MPFDWDSGLLWDSDITWDAGDSPNPGDVQQWLDLVTSEHNQKPKYMAMLEALLQPIADGQATANTLTTLFDLDTALGTFLDQIGLWVGRGRGLAVPISGVYFTFDDGPAFDSGILKGPFDPTTGVVQLPDEQYRTLLKATIAANHWDGSIPGAYAAYAIVFGPGGYTMMIVDHQDMTMTVVLGGPVPDALTLELLLGGYLNLKPCGVRVSDYIVSANPDAKIFMFDAAPDAPSAGGFDTSAFPTFYNGV